MAIPRSGERVRAPIRRPAGLTTSSPATETGAPKTSD
jgi:hypothetical protein